MTRLTRLANPSISTESLRFIFTSRRRNFAGITSLNKHTNTLHKQNSSSQNRRFTSITLFAGRREIQQFTTAMEIDGTNLPESDTSSPENLVNIQDLNPLEMSVREIDQNSSFSDSQNPNPRFDTSSGRIDSFDAFGSDNVSADTEAEGSGAPAMEDGSKKDLPKELSKNVVFLECESTAEGGSCDVYLVGTAHISQESCREVQAVISYLKPQVVFLELCSSRVAILTPQNLQVPTMREMIDTWKKKDSNIFGILYSWFLAKVANKLEVFPGSEFRVAFEEALKYGGKVILGDRPVRVTLQRTWGKMTFWHKTKFLYNIIFQTVFLPSPEDLNKILKEMDDNDMLTLVIQEMSKEFPTLMETLVYERDLYMSSTLLRIAREHSSVVAVVGKGHLQGIKKHWKQPVKVKDLMEIPEEKLSVSAVKILKSLGVAVAGVAIISGIYLAGRRSLS